MINKNIIMKNFLKIFWVFSFSLTLASCELDLLPTTAIELEDGFKTYADADKFAVGMHSKFRALQYNIFSFTAEVQGDMFNASPDYGNRNGSPHRLDGTFTTSDYSLRDVWRPTYNAILNINNFLANIDKITGKDQAEIDNLDKFKGYAYFYRAFCYHELVRRFAKDYNAATASSDLAVPIVLSANISEKPARATMADVYKLIESDLTEATKFMAKVTGVVRSETPTLDAVNALNARVKFYMKKYTEAATLAQQVISTNKYTLANTAAAMTAEFVNDNGTESIMQMYASLSEVVNANSIYQGFVAATNVYVPDFIPTQACISMYDAADLRAANWFKALSCKFSTGNVTLTLLNKYSGNPALFTAPTRTYAHKPKIFRIAEMYLIRAEALLNQAAPDPAGALTALNAIRTSRGAVLATAATMVEIKKEWARETIGEGFRIDCLKRWKDGFVDRVPQNLLHITAGNGFNIITVTSDTKKLVWAIPQTDIDVNPNLVQNEGW